MNPIPFGIIIGLSKQIITPQQVYEQISKGDFSMESILVVNMASSGMRYYGRMDVTLWEWLQDK